jgi:hypothetical protein
VVEALTVERAGELFAGLLPASGPVRAVSRFAEGSVTGGYRIEFTGADPAPVVLKIYGAGSPRFAVKEARALRFLTGHGLDISPRVLAFSRSAGALGGRPCLVSSLRPGRTLADLGAELTGTQRREVYRQLGAVLKRLMDFVRLDAFSMHVEATKMARLFSGYGVSVSGEQPGQWPPVWRSRLPLYRIALALELYNWFTISGQAGALPAIHRELRELLGEAAAEH